MVNKTDEARKAVVLNKSYVENACVGEHRDERTLGFCLRVTERGKRTFFVNARVSGTTINKTKKIGCYPDILADEARKQAQELLAALHSGIDPDAAKKKLAEEKRVADIELEAAQVTLDQAFERYLETKASKLSIQTKRVYRSEMKHFSDWSALPITSISRSMCEQRFREITKATGKKCGGPGAANLSFNFLKAVFNFAMFAYELPDGSPLLTLNPVCRISQLGLWNELNERETVIQDHQFKAVFEILDETDLLLADFVKLLLFTGLRLTSAASIEWENVDMVRRIFKTKVKGGKWQELPMSTAVYEIFQRRQDDSETYVFPSITSDGHLSTPKRLFERISQALGSHVTAHTTRKTFASIAAQTLPYGLVKKILNHSTGQDITAKHYTFISTNQLREPMEIMQKYIMDRVNGAVIVPHLRVAV